MLPARVTHGPLSESLLCGPLCGPESWEVAISQTDGSWRPEPSLLVVTVPAPGILRPTEDAVRLLPPAAAVMLGWLWGLARGSLTKTPCSACPLGKSAPRPGGRRPADSFLVAAVASLMLAKHLLTTSRRMNGG